MAVCKPTFSTGTTDLSTVPNFENFLESDPTNLFDRTELTTLNTLNNILLRNSDLSNYQNLSNRVKSGDITDQEFADFIVDSGYDIDYIKNSFIENFPVKIDYNTVRSLFENSTQVGTVSSNVSGVTTNSSIDTIDTGSEIPSGLTTETVNTGSNEDFLINTGSNISQNPDTSIVDVEVAEGVENPNWNPSEAINGILALQDKYYDNLAFNSSTCEALTNPFTKVIGVLSTLSNLSESLLGVFSSIQSLVNDISSYASLSGIIQGLQQKLGSFVNELKDKVSSIATQALAQITAIADKANSFFQDVSYLPQSVFNYVKKKIEQTRNFFKPENMKSLKGKIQSFFDNMLNQFEDKLPNVLNYFLLISCGLSNLLQDILNAPVNKLKTTVNSLTTTHDALSGYSSSVRNSAVEAGAIRMTPQQRKSESRIGVSNNNESATRRTPRPGTGDVGQWTVPSGYISPDITNDELSQLNEMGFNGFPGALTFTSGVNTMGKRATERFNSTDNPRDIIKNFPRTGNTYYGDIFGPERNFHDSETQVDAGWQMIVKNNPAHWVRLIRVSKRLQEQGHLSGTLQVNSAYRSPFYNYFMVGGAEYSNHMEGKAFDVSHANLNDEGEAAFIRACSEEGFTRIVKYRTFFHIDNDGPKSTYWQPKSLLGTQARAAWESHVKGVYQRS